MACTILLSWFKVFKYLRVFKSMGPFVVIITHSIGDIAKIAIVYVLLYIPMVCIFYQFYGDRGLPGYETVSDTMFTVFRMIVVDDYGYSSLIQTADIGTQEGDGEDVRVKRKGNYQDGDGGDVSIATGDHSGIMVDLWWTRFLVAYWIIVSSVILLNLFIALMSDTFQRVYDNAVGVAALEKAEMISELESKLSKKSRDRFLKDLVDNYSPMIEFKERCGGLGEERRSAEEEKMETLLEEVARMDRVVQNLVGELRDEMRENKEEVVERLWRLESKLS